MTNLDVETAENFSVTSYGIGGHYEAHFDYIGVSQHAIGCCHLLMRLQNDQSTSIFRDPDTGDRIATLIYYVTVLITDIPI